MTTYSLALKGRAADSTYSVANLVLPDNAGLASAVPMNARLGNPLLCKGPDGSFAYYTIDAERTTPGNIVLKAVSP